MTRTLLAAAGVLSLGLGTAGTAAAADYPLSIQQAAACAPRTLMEDEVESPLRVIGGQDTDARTLLGSRDLVVVRAGRQQGLDLGQEFFVRRDPRSAHDEEDFPRALSTKGMVQIVAVNDTTAIANIEFVCDGIVAGDFLEPYVPIELPPDIDRTDVTGELDFSSPVMVLYGDDERVNGGPGDFMVANAGVTTGVTPGSRFGIYRDLDKHGMPLASVGEAVVVTVAPDTSLFRITRARDVVQSGDLLIPRRR